MFDAFPYQKYGAGRGTGHRRVAGPDRARSARTRRSASRSRCSGSASRSTKPAAARRRAPAQLRAGHDALGQARARAPAACGRCCSTRSRRRSPDERHGMALVAAACSRCCRPRPPNAASPAWRWSRAHHGHKVDLPGLRQRFPTSIKGATLAAADRRSPPTRAVAARAAARARRARASCSCRRSSTGTSTISSCWRRSTRKARHDPRSRRPAGGTMPLARARPPFHRRRARADADRRLQADRGARPHPAQRPVEPADQLPRRDRPDPGPVAAAPADRAADALLHAADDRRGDRPGRYQPADPAAGRLRAWSIALNGGHPRAARLGGADARPVALLPARRQRRAPPAAAAARPISSGATSATCCRGSARSSRSSRC